MIGCTLTRVISAFPHMSYKLSYRNFSYPPPPPPTQSLHHEKKLGAPMLWIDVIWLSNISIQLPIFSPSSWPSKLLYMQFIVFQVLIAQSSHESRSQLQGIYFHDISLSGHYLHKFHHALVSFFCKLIHPGRRDSNKKIPLQD